MIVYHIDRNNTFKNLANNIQLSPIPKYWKNYDILSKRYPNGLSNWGLSVLGIQEGYESKGLNLAHPNNGEPGFWWDSYLIDILYEYERLASFPDMPSRFQSIFATDSLENISKWQQTFGKHAGSIYKIDIAENNFFKLDAGHLYGKINDFSLPKTQVDAHLYWSGNMRTDQYHQTELLIPLPTKFKFLGQVC